MPLRMRPHVRRSNLAAARTTPLVVAGVVALAGCDRGPTRLPAAQTSLEAKLERFSKSVNDLHRAIDLASAGRDGDAVLLLRSAARTPENLRIETLTPGEFAALGDLDRSEAAQIVELRALAARPLIDALVDDATIRRARGDSAAADETCALIAAIVETNRQSTSRFVALWSAKLADTALRACP